LAAVVRIQNKEWETTIVVPRVVERQTDWKCIVDSFVDRFVKGTGSFMLCDLKENIYYAFRLNAFGMLVLGRSTEFPKIFMKEFPAFISLLARTCVSGYAAQQQKIAAEETLKRSQEKLKLATHGTGIGIWEYDVLSDRLDWDDRIFELFGIDKSAFNHQLDDWRRVILPDAMPRAIADFRKALDSANEFSIEFPIKKFEGEIRHIASAAFVDRNENGQAIRVVGINYDITDRKRAEENVHQANQKLERLNAQLKAAMEQYNQMAVEAQAANVAKSQFLANMSHEIRTPMNGVIGMVDLLLDTNLTVEQRRFAEVIRTSADALLNLINDILDFSKIEAEKLELEIIDFNLRELLEDASEMLAVNAQEKGLEFVYRIDPKLHVFLQGDPGRLRQVLINLCGNAVKFTLQGEVILQVTCESETQDQLVARFEISDTGIGISKEKIKILFTAFQQLESSVRRRFGGTGLGLAISKRLVELMGGNIGVESIPGKGSTFWFTATFHKRFPSEECLPVITDFEGVRILAVDDNFTNRLVLSEQLSSWGVRHDMVECGKKALKMLHEANSAGDPYDVLITDMQMPNMDGESLGRMIKSDTKLSATRLVMLTSIGQRGDAVRMKNNGFSAYLTKPVKQSHLHDALAAVISKSMEPERLQSQPLVTRHSIRENRCKNHNILLVEDNIVNQMVAKKIIEKLGFKVDVAANGKEAVDILASAVYDLVFMDVQMPVMDGLTATRHIRSGNVLKPQIPVIAVTAHAMKGDREKCLEAGMNDYISKPFQPRDIEDIFHKWLPTWKKI
jgi:signal transduction histidine kinase/CheY-like chemotaxis protein